MPRLIKPLLTIEWFVLLRKDKSSVMKRFRFRLNSFAHFPPLLRYPVRLQTWLCHIGNTIYQYTIHYNDKTIWYNVILSIFHFGYCNHNYPFRLTEQDSVFLTLWPPIKLNESQISLWTKFRMSFTVNIPQSSKYWISGQMYIQTDKETTEIIKLGIVKLKIWWNSFLRLS